MAKGLYIHSPFCRTRCHYCNFVTTAEQSPDLRARFFRSLTAEITHMRERHGRLSFDTLYLGGGTPSCLAIPEMAGLIEEVHAAFEFKKDYEFTCEFNPGDGNEAKLKALQQLGVNRISLGCQTFKDEILQRLGRRHNVRDITETVAGIRKAGIQNISFDLMLRLPGQTVEDFLDSVRQCIRLDASQVSFYDLEVHAETRFGQFQKEGKLELPTEEEHARMYENAIELLTGAGRHEMPGEPRPSKDLGGAGYEHYEISNFARPGFASRHNLIYWHNQEYLGVGPGAFTYLGGIRSHFAPDLVRYLEKCEALDWKNDTEDHLSLEEQETETLAMGLRLREGVRPAMFSRVFPLFEGRIVTLCENGLMEKMDENVRLTDRGKRLSEDVFSFLLKKTRL